MLHYRSKHQAERDQAGNGGESDKEDCSGIQGGSSFLDNPCERGGEKEGHRNSNQSRQCHLHPLIVVVLAS